MRPNRVKRRHRGAILVDAMVSVFVLAMGSAALFGLMPVLHRSQKIVQNEGTATQIANRMLEHVQMLYARDLNFATLRALNLVDVQAGPNRYSFTNVPMDQASRYSPSTLLLRGQGLMIVSDLPNSAKLVTIEVSWQEPQGGRRTYRTGTVVGGYQ